MSRKQMIYRDLLTEALVYLRNAQRLREEDRPGPDALFRLGDLLHNVPEYLMAQVFAEQDLYFLNLEARGYLVDANAKGDLWYEMVCGKVELLFETVPCEMRYRLEWAGPAIGQVGGRGTGEG